MKEKQFVERGVRKVRLDEYLEEELDGAGYSHCDVVRTPTSTKIVVYAQRPGLVIGRGGSRIKELTQDLEDEFDFENPQVDVNEIEEADTSAKIAAKSMASWLEKGGSAKRVGYTYLRRMREAGVIGAEIEITGKLSGNRGRTEKFSYGYVKRCGDTSRQNVEQGYTLARTKPGAIGVKVRIMKEMPEFKHRDVDVEEEILHETLGHDEETPESEKIRRILAEAESLTSSALSEAAEEVDVDTEEIEVSEIRDAFEEMEEEELEDVEAQEPQEDGKAEKETGDEAEEETPDSGADGDGPASEAVDEQEEEATTESDEGTDYGEVVSGTVQEAKDSLQELEDPDFAEALEAEESGKDRKTLKRWIERRVEE